MSILLNKDTPVIVQGMTGTHGSFHTQRMVAYGTNIVAGVTPGKGGEPFEVEQSEKRILVFDSVPDVLVKMPELADVKDKFSALFVPAKFVKDAAMEAMESGFHLVIIAEHVSVHDAMDIMREAAKRHLVVIGPNCPGILTADEAKVGIIPGSICKRGGVGIVSRSGTLTYEIVQQLTNAGMGQSTIIGIGGDMVTGLNYVEALERFEDDPFTKQIVLIGEIGGDAEERAAEYIADKISKPVVAYVAGKMAPRGKTMGHAGAIISGSRGTFAAKKKALEAAGVRVATFPHEVVEFLS